MSNLTFAQCIEIIKSCAASSQDEVNMRQRIIAALHCEAAKQKGNAPARLDTDKKAVPLTKLIAKVEGGRRHYGMATHYEGSDKVRIALSPNCPECTLNDRVRSVANRHLCDRCGISFAK